jgi:hypothetical protein
MARNETGTGFVHEHTTVGQGPASVDIDTYKGRLPDGGTADIQIAEARNGHRTESLIIHSGKTGTAILSETGKPIKVSKFPEDDQKAASGTPYLSEVKEPREIEAARAQVLTIHKMLGITGGEHVEGSANPSQGGSKAKSGFHRE